MQTRTILVHEEDGGDECTGENLRETDCNIESCPSGKCRTLFLQYNEICDFLLLELILMSFISYFYIQTEDCIWESWNDWSTCSQSCEGGTQLRTRRLVAPERNGGECSGESLEQQDCNTEICPAGIDIKNVKIF